MPLTPPFLPERPTPHDKASHGSLLSSPMEANTMSTKKLQFLFTEFQEGRLLRDVEVTPEQLDIATGHEQAVFYGPIRVEIDGRLLPEGEVLLKARVTYSCEQACVSCLEPIRLQASELLEMLFSPEKDRPEDPKEDEALLLENPDLAYHNGYLIDLEEDVAGFILQQVPEYPRCRPDCKGLDPLTGENLNHAKPGAKSSGKDDKLEPEWKKTLRNIRL